MRETYPTLPRYGTDLLQVRLLTFETKRRQSKLLKESLDQRCRYISSDVAVCQFFYNSCCTAKICVLFSRAPCSTHPSFPITRPKQAHRRSELRASKFAWYVCR